MILVSPNLLFIAEADVAIDSVAAQETIFPPPPSISRNFVGRKDLIDNLLTYHLKPLPATHLVHWITVLWGIGGIGKTQMSIKLWEEFKSRLVIYSDYS